MPNPSARWLVMVLALGLVLRVSWDLRVGDRLADGDERSYDRIAWNVASGRGYSGAARGETPAPTATRGPGYVLLLAALYKIGGHHKLPMLLFQALLDTACIVLVWRIGRRLFPHPWLAMGGAVLYALYPPFILDAGSLLTEAYINFMVLLGVDFGLAWALEGSGRARIASGLAIGACALTKPQLGPIAVLIAISGCPDPRSRRFWTASILQVALVAAVLSPWIVRNAVVFHRFLPGVTQGGVTFWGGTGPDHGHVIGGLGEPGVPPHVLAALRGKNELEADRYLYAEGVRVIRSDPARFVRLMLKKLVRLWFNLWHDRPPSRGSVLLALFNLAMMGFAGVALATLRPPAASVRLLGWMILYFSLLHMVFYSNVRYAMPCFAYLFVFAGAALVSVGLGRRSGAAA